MYVHNYLIFCAYIAVIQHSLQPPIKVGLALIVSNDYVQNERGLHELNKISNDGNKMDEALTKLGYEVVHHVNVTSLDLFHSIGEITTLLLDSKSYKRLIFIFSGYGIIADQYHDSHSTSSGNKIYCQEGQIVNIEGVLVDPFKSFYNPKLFFFNFCQHSQDPPGKTYSTLFSPEKLKKEDNILIAYSMLPCKEIQSGSLWIELLSEAIQKQDNEITFILNNVSHRMKELYDSFTSFEAPQFVNMLKEPVNLLAESPGKDHTVHVSLDCMNYSILCVCVCVCVCVCLHACVCTCVHGCIKDLAHHICTVYT